MSNKRSLLTMATRRNGCNDRLGKQCLPDFTVHSFTSVFSIRFFHSELKQKASINFKRHFHSKTSSSDSAVNSKTTPVIDFVRPQQSNEIEWIRVNWNHRHNGIQWMRLKNLIETEFWFCRLSRTATSRVTWSNWSRQGIKSHHLKSTGCWLTL